MFATARSLVGGPQGIIHFGLWSLVLRILGLASGFAMGVVLARMLGPIQFGIYGLVTTVAALGMTVAQLGTPQLAVRELSVRAVRDDWAGVKAVIYRFGMATAIASIAIGGLALTGSVLLEAPASIRLLVFQGSILTMLTAFTGVFAAELRGLGSLLKGQLMDIAARPMLTFLIIGALLLAGLRFNALVALTIQNMVTFFAAGVSAVWLWQAIPHSVRAIRPAQSLSWLRSALPLGAVDVLRQFDGSYGVVLVGWLSTAVELGVFRVAVACAVLAAMPVTIFHILLAPTLSRLHASGAKEELQQLLSWTAGAMTAIMVPIAVGAWVLGKPFIAFLFGTAYADAWLPLFLLTVAQLTYALFGMGPILLAMCDGERHLIRIYLVAVGTAAIVGIPMTIAWGGAGAAVGPIISGGLIGLMSRRYALRKLGVEIAAHSALKQLFKHH
jgi:O-antigen/teichoic acid export membrane protein